MKDHGKFTAQIAEGFQNEPAAANAPKDAKPFLFVEDGRSSMSSLRKLPNGTPKVLIIDDCETDRYIYRRYLEQATVPYEVAEAKDGPSGLILAGTFNPNCILLDLKFPGGESGYDVLLELVGDSLPAKRTVIILTALRLTSLKEGAFSLGAADFLIKGETDAVALDSAIRQAMDKARRLSS